jgi:cyclic beta-1,2-glucan synthetase
MPENQENPASEQVLTSSESLYSSKTEQMQGFVKSLVDNYQKIDPTTLRDRKRVVLGERNLKLYETWLAQAHTYFRKISNRDLSISLASEWLLDNYYIVRQALQQISEDLPASFYKQLPKLAQGPLTGLPRVYAIGRAVLSLQNSLLNMSDLQSILIKVQESIPLTMGELWALPIFLRYSLVETLANSLVTIIRPKRSPDLPVFQAQLFGTAEIFEPNQDISQISTASAIVANIILSLRTISEQNWNDFFESVSCVERTLREDPAGIYPLMDFKTRDLYRKEIESLSLASGRGENELAEIALKLIQDESLNKTSPDGSISDGILAQQQLHVGDYLLGEKRIILEQSIGYLPDQKIKVKRWGMEHASSLYLGGIFSLSVIIWVGILIHLNFSKIFQLGSPLQFVSALALLITILVPIFVVAASLVNWLVTLRIKPRILPKLYFKDEIPDRFQTLVVIPSLIASRPEIDNLIRQLEMHFLRNPESGLYYALLTDFRDADSETLPEDEDLVKYAASGIEKLNEKYIRSKVEDVPPAEASSNQSTNTENVGMNKPLQKPMPGSVPQFYLLHRKRLWNPSEQTWMGWERKRGKLNELNRLLRGDEGTSFIAINRDKKKTVGLRKVRFVITLDSDTILPRGAARRLIGTLAHPLNHAKFDEITGRVVSGYTVLQPRMEIHPRSANHSWFTRIFAGDTGLDLYTRAVSDAYQDLFGEGSYVGKGIYDIDAFDKSTANRIPENSVLSHDLLEGIMGRAGLVTDITMIEDYPPNYIVQVKRQQRWIRGDWQLLPWLIRPKRFKIKFSAVDNWKILDNLLRSLLAPSLLLIFILGMISTPDLIGFWVLVLFFALGIPLLTSVTRSSIQTLSGEGIETAFRPLKWDIVRWLFSIAFLPYEAYNALDAILTTLYRLTISHHDLLQWTTAAQAAHVFGLDAYRKATWLRVTASAFFSLFFVGILQLVYGVNQSGLPLALAYSAPMLLLWMFSPLIGNWINQPFVTKKVPLNEDEEGLLRQVARRTWGFFERFVGPEDHWLPPDHYQESPVGIIAHHTSPSNIGLLLTSTLAAYDFGYLDQLGLSTRLSATMETLEQLERFNGHFLNWYDTLTLMPLNPRYISTVDSGNLAASLIITSQACKSMPAEHIFRWALWQGYLDTLANLTETLSGMHNAEFDGPGKEINQRITTMRKEILLVHMEPQLWVDLFQKVNEQFWPDLSKRLIELVEVNRSAFDLESLRKLQEVVGQVERHHQAIQRTLAELVPWISLFEKIPAIFKEPKLLPWLNTLKTNLPFNPVLGEVHNYVNDSLSTTSIICGLLNGIQQTVKNESGLVDLTDLNGKESEPSAEDWLEQFDQALMRARLNADALMNSYLQISLRADQLIKEMDFKFLYNPQRRVFHIGINLDSGQLDNNFYDLLASEARIASIIAISKGEVPQSHWLQLGRPLTRVEDMNVLLSWSATMFEYLMPPLFLRSYPGTLLADSAEGAVLHQIAYGKKKGVPWGISESGFYRVDANQNYQYRAFGVPGLGFKRGLGDDLVVAPYASLMAISYDPHAVAKNLSSLMELNCFGLYGLYESIDFTTNRLLVGDASMVVNEYMAHHQGMILMALINYFHKDIMVRRMHSDPRIQSVELLLQEQIPQVVPLQDPYAEDVRGVLRLTAAPVEINPWSVPVRTAIPQMNLLSNGNYGVMLSNMGGGYSTWRGIDLTRWQADRVLDPWGTWIYIQEMDQSNRGKENRAAKFWSAGLQPMTTDAANMQVTFFAHMAVFRRIERDITSTMEVTVCPDDPVEIRRINLHNTQLKTRHLRLTSYGEVILAQQKADSRHPAFNKLFIESEFLPELNLQIFTRRSRSEDEKPIFLGHMLVVENKGDLRDNRSIARPSARHEADRSRFIGRGRTFRNPIALTSEEYLTGTSGATLDPIFALGQEVEIKPHDTAQLAYLNLVGDSREAVLALARRYSSWSLIERSFYQANIAAQSWLGKQNYDSQKFIDTLQILSALLYPLKTVRTAPEIMVKNRLSQSGLWRFGISGDYPILLIDLADPKQVDLIREVLQVHEFLRSRRFLADVVILNYQQSEYSAELSGVIYRMISRLNYDQWLNQRGGIFILYGDQINSEERILLQTAARYIFSGDRGSLHDQIPEDLIHVHHLPTFIPTRATENLPAAEMNGDLKPTEPLQYFNGYGGFSRDGREYIIELSAGKSTPAPWINVIGYPNFGFMVSETGSQSTWAVNSGENRLTPWSNDPVSDPSGEALYLRDEETSDVWTPTPLPAGANKPYRVRHGAGYTIFEHSSHGLFQQLTLFASPEDPVKVIHLRVENMLDHPRRITATQYIEWVLGTTHASSMPYIIPEYDTDEACLLATNPYNAEFAERTAFLIANKPVHGLTADRAEFLGRGGSPAAPAALSRIGLETRLTPGEDPCAVLQLHMDLLPGGVEEIYFVLGQGNNKQQALELVRKYHDPAYVGAALERTRLFWDQQLGKIQVHTPEPATDLILNRWLLYQSLSCRIWGRSAFYQPSGAFGFRDQLQDVLAMLPTDPSLTRDQILNAAQRQFSEGDVMHWWHPPLGRGVRTRISDDLLWLPYVTALYVETTGDVGFLDEKIPFLQAPVLNTGEIERYNFYPQTVETYSLMEHCRRAIEKGATRGVHGLPLMGTGDWNDGLNRVGVEGKGESVWLAWFICDVLERFAKISDSRGENEIAKSYRAQLKKYSAAVEETAWDGKWYRRAYYDDGSPLGSSDQLECNIDTIAQSWSVLSGAGNKERSQQAMQSVLEKLVRPQDRLSLLFTPPFDKTTKNPGYIKGYLPGTRENGGQYTHAAVWNAWAFAKLGEGKQTADLFNLLNPIFQADTKEKADEYRVEPYVMCADIYSQPPYLRRGGWTWYTGSAAWMYRLGLEAMLGFKKIQNNLQIDPVIPPEWDGFEIHYMFGGSTYTIQVHNPDHVASHVRQIELDGQIINGGVIPLVDDGQEHKVIVIMGNKAE